MNRALIVGINDYPASPLAGCVNDTTDMAETVLDRRGAVNDARSMARTLIGYGFSEDNIRLLTDGRATTDAIRERLEWLIDKAAAGDRLLFHFSGHGAQIATRDYSGEIDGLDEVICPVDFDWTEDHLIRDDDFQELFGKLPDGVHFNWISDSCHSGGLSRNPVRNRALTPPADIAWRIRTAKAKGMRPRKIAENLKNVGFVSACREDQTAADAYIDGRPCGAFTHYFLEALKTPGLTLAGAAKVCAALLHRNGYSQIPQCCGELANKPFLGIGG